MSIDVSGTTTAMQASIAPEGGTRYRAASFRRRLLRRPATWVAIASLLLIVTLAAFAP